MKDKILMFLVKHRQSAIVYALLLVVFALVFVMNGTGIMPDWVAVPLYVLCGAVGTHFWLARKE